MIKINDNAYRWGVFALAAVAYVVFAVLIVSRINPASMWYDESGQFFIARGLNHYSEPFAPMGSLADLVYNNANYNLDPGGYSVVLRYWSLISTNEMWLRTLSMLFYAGFVGMTILLLRKATGSRLLGWVGGLLCFLLITGPTATMVRAYSMELMGVSYGLWMLMKIADRPASPTLLWLSLGLCFFITSRYTIVVIGGIYSVVALILLLCDTTRTLSRRLLRCLLYGLPLLLTVAAIYLLSYRTQSIGSWNVARYSAMFPSHKIIPIAVLAGLAIAFSLWKMLNGRMRLIVVCCAAVQIIFMALGYVKLLPYTLTGSKGAAFMYLIEVAAYCCVVALVRKYTKMSTATLSLGFSCAILLMCGAAHKYLANIHQFGWQKCGYMIDWEIENKPEHVVVLYNSNPDMRYLFEYGAYKDKAVEAGYPEKWEMRGACKHSIESVKIREEAAITMNKDLMEKPVGTILLGAMGWVGNSYGFDKSYFQQVEKREGEDFNIFVKVQ